MINPQNKRKELEHILSTDNFVKIKEAIAVLREGSPYSGVIELLVLQYDRSGSDPVKRVIRDFLNDLKDQKSCGEVVGEIKKNHNSEITRMLVSSCWQSGLNYSEYLADFAKLFLSGDYMTAIECFTVIESSAAGLDRDRKDSIIEILREGSGESLGEKKALMMELVSVLE